MTRRWSPRDYLMLVLSILAGAWLGFHGIPVGIETLARRSAKMHETFVRPSEVDCRPVAVRLTAASDVLQTVYTMNAFLENWRGELIVAVRGEDGKVGCPSTPPPEWTVDPPVALVVAPYFPNYAELYPQGPRDRGESMDFRVRARFRLEDGQVLQKEKTLHLPPRRRRQDRAVREILEGGDR